MHTEGGWMHCVQTASTAPPGRSHSMKEPKANVTPSADVVRVTSRPGPLSFTPRTFSPCPSSTASTLFSLIRCPHGCHLCPHALRPASNPFLRVSHLPALLHDRSHPVRVWPVQGDCLPRHPVSSAADHGRVRPGCCPCGPETGALGTNFRQSPSVLLLFPWCCRHL